MKHYESVTLTIAGYNFTVSDYNWLFYHRMVEAFKFGFAQRMKLGDPEFSAIVNQVYTYSSFEKIINHSCTYI